MVFNHFGPEGDTTPPSSARISDRYQTPWGDVLNVDGPRATSVAARSSTASAAWVEDYHVDGLRSTPFIASTTPRPAPSSSS